MGLSHCLHDKLDVDLERNDSFMHWKPHYNAQNAVVRWFKMKAAIMGSGVIVLLEIDWQYTAYKQIYNF